MLHILCWIAGISACWFIVGALFLATQAKDIVHHMGRLVREWERLDAIAAADRTPEDNRDFREIREELGHLVLALCCWLGPVLAVPAVLAWLKGEIFG